MRSPKRTSFASLAAILDRGIAAVGAVFLIVVVYCMAASFLSAMPYNTVRTAMATAKVSHLWVPQGWSFFTKDPQEPWLLPYRIVGRSARPAHAGRSFKLGLWWGFDRSARAQGPEMAALMAAVSKNGWRSCDEEVSACISRAEEEGAWPQVDTAVSKPTLCGQILLVQQPPPPWSWVRRGLTDMPAKSVARIDVECPSPAPPSTEERTDDR